jgi:hypothetical protein
MSNVQASKLNLKQVGRVTTIIDVDEEVVQPT